MDQGTTADNRIVDGKRFVERFAVDGNAVRAAFWMRTAEDGQSFLYVVTEVVESDGPLAAYRAAHASLQKLSDIRLAGSEIKMISPSNPIAVDILEVMRRYPGKTAIRLTETSVGHLDAEQIYVYPAHVFTHYLSEPMTTEEVGQYIFKLMNLGEIKQPPARVSLKDGTTFNGVPFSFQFGSENSLVVSFIAHGESAPRVVRLDGIASIA